MHEIVSLAKMVSGFLISISGSLAVSFHKAFVQIFIPGDEDYIEEMIAKRAQAKKDRDFAMADQIRDELAAKGIVLKDTREGTKWSRA